MPTTLVARHKRPKAPVGALDHRRFSGASYYWEPPRPSSSPYAVPARYSNPQCSSLLTMRLTWPKFRVWRPGQVPILPYAITEASLTSLTPRPGHPLQPGQQHPPQPESVYADSSGPLFSMYLKLAGEEDVKMTENWKGDADGILIFVSRHSCCTTLNAGSPRVRRLVYSPPLSQHLLRYLSRTSSRVPRTSQRSTSQTSTKSSMDPRSLSPLHFPIRPFHFLHQPPPYGSTHSGFSACSLVSHAHFWPHYSSNGPVGT